MVFFFGLVWYYMVGICFSLCFLRSLYLGLKKRSTKKYSLHGLCHVILEDDNKERSQYLNSNNLISNFSRGKGFVSWLLTCVSNYEKIIKR
jgi:hypothetical protein